MRHHVSSSRIWRSASGVVRTGLAIAPRTKLRDDLLGGCGLSCLGLLQTTGNRGIERGTLALVELVALIVDDEVEHGPLREIDRLVDGQSAVLDGGTNAHDFSVARRPDTSKNSSASLGNGSQIVRPQGPARQPVVVVGQRVMATIVQIEPYGVWFEYERNRILVLITDLPFEAPTRPPEIFSVGEQREVLLTELVENAQYEGVLAVN